MKYEAVIFDLFGTLVDYLTEEEYRQANEEFAAILGAPADIFRDVWHESRFYRDEGRFGSLEMDIDYVCQLLGLKVTRKQIARAAEARLELNLSHPPRNGAAETLSALRSAGCKIGLISDCAGEIPRLWPASPFRGLVDVPVFSCTEGVRKPDPRIYHRTCERLGVQPSRCLYVGDGGSNELSGALQAGMTSVMILRTGYGPLDPLPMGVEAWDGKVIGELPEIVELAASKHSVVSAQG